MELDYHSLQLIDKEGMTFFHVSDLRDAEGYVTDVFVGDGSTVEFKLETTANTPDRITVTVDDNVVTSGITKSYSKVTFGTAPSSGSVVNIRYQPAILGMIKAYTIGVRKNSSHVGLCSVAEGYYTTASGLLSHAEGGNTIASGLNSHAEGNNTRAYGYCSHAEGSNTFAAGVSNVSGCSHAEGQGTSAYGPQAHAEGYFTTAGSSDTMNDNGYAGCHAEGYTTVATGGQGAHAEGRSSKAYGYYSHAEGYNTVANGDSSHAEGNNTTAYGYHSHAEGENTLAN